MQQAWVPMKCGQSAMVMIAHFELAGGCWSLTSVAPAPDAATRTEVRSPMMGQFGLAEQYGGCLGCGAGSYVRCGQCVQLGCWNPVQPWFRCAWCGQSGEVTGGIESLNPADWT